MTREQLLEGIAVCISGAPFPSKKSLAKAQSVIDYISQMMVDALGAAKEIHTLHMCEQEGLSSGMPTRDEWIDAVDRLGEALAQLECFVVKGGVA